MPDLCPAILILGPKNHILVRRKVNLIFCVLESRKVKNGRLNPKIV